MRKKEKKIRKLFKKLQCAREKEKKKSCLCRKKKSGLSQGLSAFSCSFLTAFGANSRELGGVERGSGDLIVLGSLSMTASVSMSFLNRSGS